MNRAKDRSRESSAQPAGQFARNSAFGTVAGFATALGSVVASIIVAHLLGVEKTGLVAFALWGIMVAATIGDLGVQSTLARYLPELIGAGKPEEAEQMTGWLMLTLIVSCAAIGSGFVAYAIWGGASTGLIGGARAIWLLVSLGCVLQTLAGFTYGYLRGVQRFGHLARVTLISVIAQLVCVAAGALTMGVSGALAGYCTGSALPALLSFRYGRWQHVPTRSLRERIRRYGLYSWAAALSSVLVWSRAEVFFLQRSTGSAAVGLFTVGVTLANLASQGPMLLTAAMLPHFSQRFGRGQLDEMRQSCAAAVRVLGFLVFPACCGMVAILPTVLPFLYGKEFAGAVPAASLLILAGGVGSTASVITSLIMAMDRSDFNFVSGLAAAALMVVAGVTVIPVYGLMGAAWSRAVIQVFAVVLGVWFAVARLGLVLPVSHLCRLLIAAGLCGGAARLCLWLQPGAMNLPFAITAGAIVYIAAIRTLKALPRSDLERLREFARSLPPLLCKAVDLALRMLGGPAGASLTRDGLADSEERPPAASQRDVFAGPRVRYGAAGDAD